MNKIIINYLFGDKKEFEIVSLSGKRDWMTETPQGYAYRCVPLTVANTYGWSVLNPHDFVAEWSGDDAFDGVSVRFKEYNHGYASSHFGSGILTIHPDFIIKTEQGISTFVRGVPNSLQDGIEPLDGIIETDWLPFTFTFNYKFTKPGIVHFKKGEPLFSFFPVERAFIEKFEIHTQRIDADPEFQADYNAYSKSRLDYLNNNTGKYQKYYADGKGPDKSYDIVNHQKRTNVQKPK
jgi:hypothetical protein